MRTMQCEQTIVHNESKAEWRAKACAKGENFWLRGLELQGMLLGMQPEDDAWRVAKNLTEGEERDIGVATTQCRRACKHFCHDAPPPETSSSSSSSETSSSSSETHDDAAEDVIGTTEDNMKISSCSSKETNDEHVSDLTEHNMKIHLASVSPRVSDLIKHNMEIDLKYAKYYATIMKMEEMLASPLFGAKCWREHVRLAPPTDKINDIQALEARCGIRIPSSPLWHRVIPRTPPLEQKRKWKFGYLFDVQHEGEEDATGRKKAKVEM